MRTEKLEFTGHAGETLAARLDLPEGEPKAVALFAHCFTCTKDLIAARRIAGRLAAQGIGVLRFDFTGLGHSGGEFENTDFSSNVGDLVAAAHHLDEERKLRPSLLIGHSLGGAAVLAAAEHIPWAKAVVTIGAPSDPAHVLQHFHAKLSDIREKGKAEVRLGGRTFTIGSDFLEDVEKTRLADKIGRLDRALLVLHAPLDEIVGIGNATDIFLAAKHPKSFVTLDDADHLLTRAADAEYAADVIAAWSRRYLGLKEEEATEAAPEGVVRVSEADAEGFLQDVAAGKHQMKADEPEDHGGTDLGPSPYQFVSAGLGTCTSMTVRMYARRKGWPLEHVEVDVSHDKVHAKDCEDCEDKSAKIDVFRRVLRFKGDLSEEQREKLKEIAGKCPVHRTLEGKIRVETELEE
jgi:putative redox protein